MKKLIVVILLVLMGLTQPAFGQMEEGRHALGDIYTRALNMIEACGMLDRLDTRQHVPIEDIHMDHGQVLVTVLKDTGPMTIAYEPMFNKILYGDKP